MNKIYFSFAKLRICLSALLIAVLPVLGAAQEDKLSINADSAFMDMDGVDNGIVPVEVTVANAGKDAVGAVTMSMGDYRMEYPVELPSGSKKRFFAYMPISLQSMFSSRGEFTLNTNQGSAKQFYELRQVLGGNSRFVLYIGDQPGLMTFMRQPADAPSNAFSSGADTGFRDVYGKPGRLPTRACGYRSISTVVLGAGSERLTDEEVEALKLYAISGGTIVIVGGVSAPILSDPRWSSYLPVRSAYPVTVPAFKWLQQFGRGGGLTGSISALKGDPAQNADCTMENGIPIVCTSPLGLGRMIFLAFSPFEGRMETWSGRQSMFGYLMGGWQSSAFDELTRLNQDNSGYPGAYSSPYMSVGSEPQDPFKVKLPAVGIVVMILLAYTVLVVPINLFILRKVNRSEWAWWTTPFISLGFAAIFFQFASRLYSASLSTARSGIVVVDDRCDSGLFIGGIRMFFPRGGSYDLGLEGVETVLPIPDYNYSIGGRNSSAMDSMNALDIGEVKVDSMRVKNLSFQEFAMVQKLPSAKWLQADLVDTVVNEYGTKVHVVKGSIKNLSPYNIDGAIYVNLTRGSQVYLAAGSSAEINQRIVASKASTQTSPNNLGPYSTRGFAPSSMPPGLETMPMTTSFAKTERVLLIGTISGFKPGPTIGTDTKTGSSIKFYGLLGSTVVRGAK